MAKSTKKKTAKKAAKKTATKAPMDATAAHEQARALWGDQAFAHLDTKNDMHGEHRVCAVGHGRHKWTASTFEAALAAAQGRTA